MNRLLVLLFVACTTVSRAELAWENATQEFQCRVEDKELIVRFPFKNVGSRAVTITQVSPSCGCTTADLPKKTFAPEEVGELTAKFSFGARRGMQEKTITVSTDDQQKTKLAFKCLILEDPVTLASSLVWWKVGETPSAKQVDVSIGTAPAIEVTAVASTNPRINAVLSTVKPGEKYAVNIQPTDTAKPEAGEVFVQTNYPPEGPKAYTIQVRVK